MSYPELPADESKIFRKEWGCVEDFILDVKVKPVLSGSHHHNTCGKSGWYGTETFDEAMTQFENGWPEGLREIQALSKDLKHIEGEKCDRHSAVFAECGEEVDVDRFIQGEPECMVDFNVVQVPSAGRVVKIIVNQTASAALSARSLFLRGSAAVLLADVVEQAGLRSEIWSVAASGHNNNGYDIRVLVKAPDQPLELDRCAFALSSPSMLRRMFFKAMEQNERQTFLRFFGKRLGHPVNIKKENGAILVDSLQYGFGNNLTDETVPKFVNAMVEKYFEQ